MTVPELFVSMRVGSQNREPFWTIRIRWRDRHNPETKFYNWEKLLKR